MKRILLMALCLLVQAGHAAAGELTVYKSPGCQCCSGWIEHVQAQGWSTRIEQPRDLDAVKTALHVPVAARSCHTAVSADGHVFEGHVPARYIRQFLANPPSDALGLAVPGMPMGSPGMEYGGRFTPYDVMLLKRDGSRTIYASVDSPDEQ